VQLSSNLNYTSSKW